MTEYKLVPIEPTAEMMMNEATCQRHAPFDMSCVARSNRMRIWKAMLDAAPPQQQIDVEKIQEELYGKDGFGSRCTIRRECIKLLAASGYLHAPQPRIDVEKLKLDVFNAYERCRGILPEVLENIDKDRLNSHLAYRMISFAIDHLAAHYNITKKGE